MELTAENVKMVMDVAKAMGTVPAPTPGDGYAPGDKVFIRSVTNYYTGRVLRETATDIYLTDAAWIPSTGRFAAFLASGEPDECEPYPDGLVVRVPKGGIVDACEWRHDLPRKVK